MERGRSMTCCENKTWPGWTTTEIHIQFFVKFNKNCLFLLSDAFYSALCGTTITIFAVGLKARLLCVCVRNATRNTENKNKKKNKKRNKNSAATLLLFVLKIRRSKKSPKKRHRNSALSNGCPPCDHLIYQHRPRQLNYNIPDYTINTTRSLAARFAAACRFSMKPFEIESTESTESTVMLIFVRAKPRAKPRAFCIFAISLLFFAGGFIHGAIRTSCVLHIVKLINFPKNSLNSVCT